MVLSFLERARFLLLVIPLLGGVSAAFTACAGGSGTIGSGASVDGGDDDDLSHEDDPCSTGYGYGYRKPCR